LIGKNFEEVWSTVRGFEGQEFKTKSGKKFKYFCVNDSLGISLREQKINQHIDEKNFFRAYQYTTSYHVSAPDDIDRIAAYKGDCNVQGSPYIWAILNDKRIM
jgi:hypothetical protein